VAELSGVTAKLTEYGVVGVLILVNILVMGYLLQHVLNQTKDDRKTWTAQSEKFLTALDGLVKTCVSTNEQSKETLQKIELLRDDIRKT
jgi:hypothetical protein